MTVPATRPSRVWLPRPRSGRKTIQIASLALFAPLLSAQDESTAIASATKRFVKAHVGSGSSKKREAAESVFRGLWEQANAEALVACEETERWDRYRTSLESYAHLAFDPEGVQKSEFRTKKKKLSKAPAPGESAWPESEFVTYAFGTRALSAECKSAAKLLQRLEKKGLPFTASDLPVERRVEELLRGAFPERELILAGLQRALDVDRGADHFSNFLESWRNQGPRGDESFYEALDRTAGTDQSVFFFDIMLAGFTKKFGDQAGMKSLDVAHDHLHQAFLTYRQYRGFVEAISLALTLPADQSFPERLKRYDYSATAHFPPDRDYSTRHMIDALLEHHGHDTSKIVEIVSDLLRDHPLPEQLWSGSYDPVSLLGQHFSESGIPDPRTARENAQRRSNAIAKAIQAVAFQTLTAPESR